MNALDNRRLICYLTTMKLVPTSIGGALFAFLLIVFIGVCWCVNLYKLTQCDFQAPYKGEVVHAVGLIPLAAPFTVWNSDK